MAKPNFLCFLLAVALLAGCGTLDEEPTTVEVWHCLSDRQAVRYSLYGYYDEVAVVLTRSLVEHDGISEVGMANVSYPAIFRMDGLYRRWSFGHSLEYSFTITPDGAGAYYDFVGAEPGEERTPKRIFTTCVRS